MWGRATRQVVLGLGLAALAAAILAGCGGSSDSGDSPPPGNPSKLFVGPKGEENPKAKFGHESSADELAEAGSVVEESIQARSRREWAALCATMSVHAVEFVLGAGTKQEECAAKFAADVKEAPQGILKQILRNNMEGPVVAFRVIGDRGYAFYHGDDKKDWAMKMEREGSEWKVALTIPEELAR